MYENWFRGCKWRPWQSEEENLLPWHFWTFREFSTSHWSRGSSERQKENSISKEVHEINQLPHKKTSSISNLSTLFNPSSCSDSPSIAKYATRNMKAMKGRCKSFLTKRLNILHHLYNILQLISTFHPRISEHLQALINALSQYFCAAKGRCLDTVVTGALQLNKTEFLGFPFTYLGKKGTKRGEKINKWCNALKYLESRYTVNTLKYLEQTGFQVFT